MPEPDKILEGEILEPVSARAQYQERVFVRVGKLGWLAKLLLALGALGILFVALFLSFWIIVLGLPLLAGLALWSWASSRLR